MVVWLREGKLTIKEKIVCAPKFEQPVRTTLRRNKKITEDKKSSCGCTAPNQFNTHSNLLDAVSEKGDAALFD